MGENNFNFSDNNLEKVISFYNRETVFELCFIAFGALIYIPFLDLYFYTLGMSKLYSFLGVLTVLLLSFSVVYFFCNKVKLYFMNKVAQENKINLAAFKEFADFHKENTGFKSYNFINKKHYTYFLVYFMSFLGMRFIIDFLTS